VNITEKMIGDMVDDVATPGSFLHNRLCNIAYNAVIELDATPHHLHLALATWSRREDAGPVLLPYLIKDSMQRRETGAGNTSRRYPHTYPPHPGQ
jgi:hypothetical protein